MGRECSDKGKGKAVEQPKKKKSKAQKEMDHTIAAADVAVSQRGFEIRDITTPTRRSTRTRSAAWLGSTPFGQSGSRKRALHEPMIEEEEQPQLEQSQSQGEIRLHDLASYKSPKIKKLRFVMIDEWFPRSEMRG